MMAVALGLPRSGRADTTNIDYIKSDQRGSLVHAVPLTNRRVRMAAERVVLVPYWDAKARGPRLLAHVWYDFVNEGPPGGLPSLSRRTCPTAPARISSR